MSTALVAVWLMLTVEIEVEAASKGGLDRNKGKLITALRQYTKATNIAINGREAFGLTEDVARIEELTQRLEEIKKTISRSQDVTSKSGTTGTCCRLLVVNAALPPEVAQALVGLSGIRATQDLEHQIDEAVKRQGEDTTFALPAPRQVILESWNLEDELKPWNTMPTADLWKLMGPTREHQVNGTSVTTLPGMTPCYDDDDEMTSWGRTDGTPWWLDPAIPDKRKIPATLNHHQLVGVHKAIRWVAEGKGGLIADEVGVGKTAQVIATIQLREQLLYMKKKGYSYPAGLGECHSFSHAR